MSLNQCGHRCRSSSNPRFRHAQLEGWHGQLPLFIAITAVQPLTLVNLSIVVGMVVMPLPIIQSFGRPPPGTSWEITSIAV